MITIAALVALGWIVVALRTDRLKGQHRALAVATILTPPLLILLIFYRNEIDRYRITVLGTRHALTDSAFAPLSDTLIVGGDPSASTVFVPAVGQDEAVRLVAVVDSPGAPVALQASATEDAEAVLLYRPIPSGLGRLLPGNRRWSVVGATPIKSTSQVRVRTPSAVRVLRFAASHDKLGRVRHRVISGGGNLALSAASRNPLGFGRNVLRRAFPLADVLEQLPGGADQWGLGSFLYYEGNTLYLVDLDSEVEVLNTAPLDPIVWRAGTRTDFTVSALPARDFPESNIDPPERLGVHPLLSFTASGTGRWIDFQVQSKTKIVLTQDDLGPLVDSDAGRYWAVRLTADPRSTVSDAVFVGPTAGPLAQAAEAVLRLPESRRAKEFHVLTPRGQTQWQTGKAIPFGSAVGPNLVVRVDRQALHAGSIAVLGLLGLGIAFAFGLTPMPGPVLALAVGALALGLTRLLIVFAVFLEYPYVDDAHGDGFWFLGVLPWAIAAFALAGAEFQYGWRRNPADQESVAAIRRTVLAGLILAILTGALVGRGMALIPLTIAGALFLARGTGRKAARWSQWLPGTALVGAALVVIARLLLVVVARLEAIYLGSTRFSLGILFTPLVLLFAVLLFYVFFGPPSSAATASDSNSKLASFFRGDRLYALSPPKRGVRGLVILGTYLFLVFGAIPVVVQDIGAGLTGSVGLFLLLAYIGFWGWVRPAMPTRIAPLLTIPLAAFFFIQCFPGVIRTLLPGGEMGPPEIARVQDWNTFHLRLLEREDPESLRRIGHRRSEALLIMRELMDAYTDRNVLGHGFLGAPVAGEIAATAPREHVPSVIVAGQWGFLAGTVGLILIVTLVSAPTGLLLRGPWREDGAVLPMPPLAALVSAAFLLTMTGTGLYMILANHGVFLFTGKNVYGLGVDSLSDIAETLAVVGIGAFALGLHLVTTRGFPDRSGRGATAAPLATRLRNA